MRDTSTPTWLFHLPLRGRETGQVESLASYTIRLATAHVQRPSSLVHRAMEWRALGQPQNVGRWRRKISILKLVSQMNGPTIGRRWTEALENGTGNSNLQVATIQRWAHLFPMRGLLRRTHAWCPECLSEPEPYDRLLWSLAPVAACPKHGCRLILRCPGCNSHFPVIHARSVIGLCPQCGSCLSDQLPLQTEPASSFEMWVAREVELFLSVIEQRDDLHSLPPIRQTIATCMNRTGLTDCAGLANLVKTSRISAWYWCHRGVVPDLAHSLHLAYAFGVHLHELVTGELPRQLTLVCTPAVPPLQARRRAQRFVAQNVLLKIEEFRRRRATTPPSMTEVARELGFNPEVVRKHLPIVCREISRAHLEFNRANVAARRAALREEIRKAKVQCQADATLASQHFVQLKLRKPGILRSPYARTCLHQMDLPLE